MHATCSNDISPSATACAPGSAATLIAMGSQVDTYLQELMGTITPDMLEEDGRLRLVVGNETLASVVRGLLEARGHSHVDVEVSAPVSVVAPTYPPEVWTREMAAAKEAAGRMQEPRHRSPFTKSQPSPKARKAARKRAKAGRKAAR